MTFAWYGHLGGLKDKALYIAVAVSWGHRVFSNTCSRFPRNRIGSSEYSVAELKILQEVISLSVFVPIAVLYLKQPLKWDYLWASLCIVGAVFFIFRERNFSDTPIAPAAPENASHRKARDAVTSPLAALPGLSLCL